MTVGSTIVVRTYRLGGITLTPIVDPTVIYAIDLAFKLRIFSIILFIASAGASAILYLGYTSALSDLDFDLSNDFKNHLRKITLPVAALSLLLILVIPSREVCTEMLIFNLISNENFEEIKNDLPSFIEAVINIVNN